MMTDETNVLWELDELREAAKSDHGTAREEYFNALDDAYPWLRKAASGRIVTGAERRREERDLWFSEFEKNCPLRQLAKWAETSGRHVFMCHLGDGPQVAGGVIDGEGFETILADSRGPTILEAATDAVHQLIERGEL